MRIAVLRGGPSAHYENSLKTGGHVLSLLREMPEKYEPVDVFISKNGEWHIMGRRQDPQKALIHIDLVWNALHGNYGEDGEVSRLLSNLNMPHTGSGTLGLTISFSKDLAKNIYAKSGLLTPKHEVVTHDASLDDLLHIFRTYVHPVMVKPVHGRFSLGEEMVHSFEELKHAVAGAFSHAERVMVEEYIRGTEASCAVMERFRDQDLYTLIPSPNEFKPSIHKQIEHMAREAHKSLGLRHYSSSDFVVTSKGRIYILETNALPEFDQDSALSASLSSVGISPKEFIEHVVSLAV
ncbi:hypothetical protein KW796_01015 [Candidatus Parcubacteria bacterium]|nr:hypothetical protein [Candidatus Parcubacteria bacterium]